MTDSADLIEKSEIELLAIIERLHRAGVRYSVVHGVFVEMLKTLEMRGYAEEWLSQYGKSDAPE